MRYHISARKKRYQIRVRTLLIRTPKFTRAFTASISGRVNRACWYSRLRSSSGTPSRYWMYSAMMRTLLELLSQTWSGSCRHVFAYNEHDFLAVQERYHFFDQSLWHFTLRGYPS